VAFLLDDFFTAAFFAGAFRPPRLAGVLPAWVRRTEASRAEPRPAAAFLPDRFFAFFLLAARAICSSWRTDRAVSCVAALHDSLPVLQDGCRSGRAQALRLDGASGVRIRRHEDTHRPRAMPQKRDRLRQNEVRQHVRCDAASGAATAREGWGTAKRACDRGTQSHAMPQAAVASSCAMAVCSRPCGMTGWQNRRPASRSWPSSAGLNSGCRSFM
jgi:hypothetical protein